MTILSSYPTSRPSVAPMTKSPTALPIKNKLSPTNRPSFRPSSSSSSPNIIANTIFPTSKIVPISSSVPTKHNDGIILVQHKKQLDVGSIIGIIIAVLASIGLVYFAIRRYKTHQQEKDKTRHSILKTYADEYSQEDFINPVLEASARAPKSVRSARGWRPSRTILASADSNIDVFGGSSDRKEHIRGHMPVDNEVVKNPMHAEADNVSSDMSGLLTIPLETPGGPQNLRPISKQLFSHHVAYAADLSSASPVHLAAYLSEQSVSSPLLTAFSARQSSPQQHRGPQYDILLDRSNDNDPEYSDVSVLVDDEGVVDSGPVTETLAASPPTNPNPSVSTTTTMNPLLTNSPVIEESDEFDRLTAPAGTSGSNKNTTSIIASTSNASILQPTNSIRTMQTDIERPCGRSPPTPDSGALQSPLSLSFQSLDISPILKPSQPLLTGAQSPNSSSPSRASVIHMSVLGASALMARESISTPISSKSVNDIDIESPSPLTVAKLSSTSENSKTKRGSNPSSPIKRTDRSSQSVTSVNSRHTTPHSVNQDDASVTSRHDSARRGGFLEDTETSRQRRRDRNSALEISVRCDIDDTTPTKSSPKKSIVEDIERARWPEVLQGDGHRFHKPLAEPRAIYPISTRASQTSLGGDDGNLSSQLDSESTSKQKNEATDGDGKN